MSATMGDIFKANTVQRPIETGRKLKANTLKRPFETGLKLKANTGQQPIENGSQIKCKYSTAQPVETVQKLSGEVGPQKRQPIQSRPLKY